PLGSTAIDCPLDGTSTTLTVWLSGLVRPSTVKGTVLELSGPTTTRTGPEMAVVGTRTVSEAGSPVDGATATPPPKTTVFCTGLLLNPVPDRTIGLPGSAAGAFTAARFKTGADPVVMVNVPGLVRAFPL